MGSDRESQSGLPTSILRALPTVLGVLAYFLVSWAPVVAVFSQLSPQVLLSLHCEARRVTLLVRSFSWAVLVGLLGMMLGVVAALALWRCRHGWGAAARWLFLAGAALPPYTHILAWWSVLRFLNHSLSGVGLMALPQRGGLISLWVQMMAQLPLVAGLALVGFLSIETSLIEAGCIYQTGPRVFRRIVLPLARPMVLAGGALLFVLALVDYGIPSTFQFPTAALEVFVEFGASASVGRATALALPALLVAALALAMSLAGLRKAVLTKGQPRRVASSSPALNISRIWLWAALALLLLQAVLPVVSLLLSVKSWRNLLDALVGAMPELQTSLWTAGVAALLSPLVALAPARTLAAGRARLGVWFLLLVPVAMPGALVGIGLVSLWSRLAVTPYGTRWMPVLAALARFTPMAIPVLVAQRRRMAEPLIEAARVFARPWDVWWRVELPMTLPGLVSAACLVFVLTLGELGATLIVVPPGYATLTMRIYTYLHYGASEGVAALSLALSLICLLVGALGFMVWRLWSRAAMRVGA